MADQTPTQGGISRRDALKRGAAVGAAVWAAPMVTAVPAHATEGSVPNIGFCDVKPEAKWNVPRLTTPGLVGQAPGNWADEIGGSTCGLAVDGSVADWANLPSGMPTTYGWKTEINGAQYWEEEWKTKYGTFVGTAKYVGTKWEYQITAPKDCRILAEIAKQGRAFCVPASGLYHVDPLPQETQIYTNGGPGRGLSHITIVLCCLD